MRPWSLTTSLAAIEADVWSTTPFTAVGLLTPAADGFVRFEMRSQQVATANVIRLEELPFLFRAPSATEVAVARLNLDVNRAVDRLMSFGGLETLVMMPVGSSDPPTTCWAARPDGRTIEPDERRMFEHLVERARALADAGEPADVRDRRLMRFDALSSLLSTLAEALDVRDVFGRLSTLTRTILPHDASVVGIFEDDARKVRPHAISMPDGWTLPPVLTIPYPTVLHGGWEFAVHHDMAANPIEREWPMARLGMRTTLRMPVFL